MYYETELLKKLGIEEQVKPKSKRILSERVGTVVARGDAALGLQQVSELLPIEGIEFIGVLPPEVQRMTVFSAGVTTKAREPEAARQLIAFFRPRRRRRRSSRAGWNRRPGRERGEPDAHSQSESRSDRANKRARAS